MRYSEVAMCLQALAAQQGLANPYMLQAAAAGQTLNPSGLNSAALAALVSAGVGNPSWMAPAAQLQGSSSMLPTGPVFSSGHALQQQVASKPTLGRLQAPETAMLLLSMQSFCFHASSPLMFKSVKRSRLMNRALPAGPTGAG